MPLSLCGAKLKVIFGRTRTTMSTRATAVTRSTTTLRSRRRDEGFRVAFPHPFEPGLGPAVEGRGQGLEEAQEEPSRDSEGCPRTKG